MKHPIFVCGLLVACMSMSNLIAEDKQVEDQTATPRLVVLNAGKIRAEVSADSESIQVMVPERQTVASLRVWSAVKGWKADACGTFQSLPGGGVSWERLLHYRDSTIRVKETLSPVPGEPSLRWDIDVFAPTNGNVTIETHLQWMGQTNAIEYWTAWDKSGASAIGPIGSALYQNPLCLMPLRDASYGLGDTMSVPIVTLADVANDVAFSLAQSPNDFLMGVTLQVNRTGEASLARSGHQADKSDVALHFTSLISAHAADWREGLGIMTRVFPTAFNPASELAYQVDGCGAYSGDENPIQVEKFKKMAFGYNWKLSDDFVYMGMFIPPVKNIDERWKRACAEPRPPKKPDTTSCRQLNDYAKYMASNGFHVLSYFNITEYGRKMTAREIPADRAEDPNLCQDPEAYLALKLSTGNPTPKTPVIGRSNCYGAYVVDPGDPVYLQFLVEQAGRHVNLLPDASGVCIDRLDHVGKFNANAPVTTYANNRFAGRPLLVSFHLAMEKIAPIFHKAGKVMFANPIGTYRVDAFRHLDGVYDEYRSERNINRDAWMCVRKPMTIWNAPKGDVGFQEALYLAAFPTAPFPGNNHTVGPDPKLEQWYLDYGPLLNAIRGKRWVLLPHVIEVENDVALANLFEVPGGYAAPIVFGGDAAGARVSIRGLPQLPVAFDVLHPGNETPVAITPKNRDGVLVLDVPLVRGCAVVRMRVKMKAAMSVLLSGGWTAVGRGDGPTGKLAALDPAKVKVGGEIGRRIDVAIANNQLVVDVDELVAK
ncbi:MAG: hypothetical protein ABR915_17835 [Thermoguttaceae bacterium]